MRSLCWSRTNLSIEGGDRHEEVRLVVIELPGGQGWGARAFACTGRLVAELLGLEAMSTAAGATATATLTAPGGTWVAARIGGGCCG